MEDLFEVIARKQYKYQTKYRNNWLLICVKLIVLLINKLFRILFSFKFKHNRVQDGFIRIGICMSGGIGDALINLNYIYCLRNYLGYDNIKIDLYSAKPIPSAFLKDKNFIDEYYVGENYEIADYDIFFRLIRFPSIYKFDKKRIKKKSEKVFNLFKLYEKFKEKYYNVVSQEPSFDSVGKDIALASNHIRLQQPDIGNVLGIEPEYVLPIEVENIDLTLEKFNLKGKQFITINRGVGTKLSQSPKLWSLENYNSLIKLFKEKYPDYVLVQIGNSKNTMGIMDNTDINLVGKTTFEELLVLLKTATLHIDCEGGLVHLRKALNAPPSVVLFGPTSKDFFGYSSNINIKAENACKIACEWVSNDWETRCIKTNSEINPCMQAISPEMVMEKLVNFFAENKVN